VYRDKGPENIDPRSLAESESLTGAGGFKQTPKSTRPGGLWQWNNFGSYLEFTALLIAFHCATFLMLHTLAWYIVLLGFIALGLEATVCRLVQWGSL
jgi:hypothetical protein